MPKGRQAANDRAPTLEELQKLTEYPEGELSHLSTRFWTKDRLESIKGFLGLPHC